MSLLTKNQIRALEIAFSVYLLKKKIERRMVGYIFKKVTGHDLSPIYYSIPIIHKILEIAN